MQFRAEQFQKTKREKDVTCIYKPLVPQGAKAIF